MPGQIKDVCLGCATRPKITIYVEGKSTKITLREYVIRRAPHSPRALEWRPPPVEATIEARNGAAVIASLDRLPRVDEPVIAPSERRYHLPNANRETKILRPAERLDNVCHINGTIGALTIGLRVGVTWYEAAPDGDRIQRYAYTTVRALGYGTEEGMIGEDTPLAVVIVEGAERVIPARLLDLYPSAPHEAPCAIAMGCLCAGHARGNAPTEPCDTRE